MVFELGEPALVNRDVFFEIAPGLLVPFQPAPRRLDGLLALVQTRIGISETLRMCGDGRPRVRKRGLELLELDEPL